MDNTMRLIPKPNTKKANLSLTIFDYSISAQELYDIFDMKTKQEYFTTRETEGNTLNDLILYLFLKYDADTVNDFINQSFDMKTIKQLKS